MSQIGALYVTAYELADEASTTCARNYYMGMRDAFEGVLRGLRSPDPDEASWDVAWGILNRMDPTVRGQVLSDCRGLLTSCRTAARDATVAVI